MHARQLLARIFLGLSMLTVLGCAALGFLPFGRSTQTPPVKLAPCAGNPTVLCLISFGLDRNQMLVSFYVASLTPTRFYLKVRHASTTTTYPCDTVEDSPSTIYCAGPQMPLGTTVGLDLYASQGNVLVGQGDFTIYALALPTVGIGGTAAATYVGTAGPSFYTPALTAILPFFTPPITTPGPFGTPSPGTAYPNP